MNLSVPASHCPKCGSQIKLYDNIPIIAWLVLRGKCRECKIAIPPRYIIIEACTGLMWFAVVYSGKYYDLPLSQVMGMLILTSVLISASLIDIETRTIPIQLSYFGICFALIFSLAFPQSQLLSSDHGLFEIQPAYSFLNELNPRLRSLFHCLFNITIAYIFMYLCAKLGKKVFGQHKVICDPPVQVKLNKTCCQAEDDEPLEWKEILTEKDEKIQFFTNDDGKIEINSEGKATKNGLDWKIEPEKKIFVKNLNFPSAVIGGGDLKLITLCSAFIGIQGSLVSLGFASFLGMIYLAISKREVKMTQRAIPFAPFIAIAAYSWILLWPFFIEKIRLFIEALRS
ncbi:MAG: prepilin peptidase [Lentisphaeria bacterium]|nr:prepilin peptidase [Lentisphaeria bacterium]